jgi:hypothetical protein
LRCSTQFIGTWRVSFFQVRFPGCPPIEDGIRDVGSEEGALQNLARVTGDLLRIGPT